MKVFIPRKVAGADARAAASRGTVTKLAGLGAEALAQSGPGPGSRVADEAISGETVEVAPAHVIGHLDAPGRLAEPASLPDAKNLPAIRETPIEEDATSFRGDFRARLVGSTLPTRNGATVDPRIAPASTRAEGAD